MRREVLYKVRSQSSLSTVTAIYDNLPQVILTEDYLYINHSTYFKGQWKIFYKVFQISLSGLTGSTRKAHLSTSEQALSRLDKYGMHLKWETYKIFGPIGKKYKILVLTATRLTDKLFNQWNVKYKLSKGLHAGLISENCKTF